MDALAPGLRSGGVTMVYRALSLKNPFVCTCVQYVDTCPHIDDHAWPGHGFQRGFLDSVQLRGVLDRVVVRLVTALGFHSSGSLGGSASMPLARELMSRELLLQMLCLAFRETRLCGP